MTNFVVNTTADSGAGSLRQAVLDANASAGADVIRFANGLSGTINLASHLTLSSAVSIDGDTNGDGEADITLRSSNTSDMAILVSAAGTAELTSLNFANGVNSNYIGVISNQGNLTLAYSVISGNIIDTSGNTDGGYATPVFNSGTMVVNQTLFANNVATGDNGYGAPNSGLNGYRGGFASASILNNAGASLTTTALALVDGSATGGNGGVGGNGQAPGHPNGFNGGNGGAASVGVLNLGTMSGTYNGSGSPVATGGSGGAGGAGVNGGVAGANGILGLSSTGSPSIAGGTGVLNYVTTGNNAANVLSGEYSPIFFGLGGNDNLYGISGGSKLYGGSGHDMLTSLGSSQLRGGLGNDVLRNLIIRNDGAGIWDGGAGIDTFDASLSITPSALQLNLSTGVNNFQGTVLNIENITGTNNAALNDSLTGNNGVNIIRGLAGADVLDGGAGADVMFGGAGNDLLYVDDALDAVTELSGEGTADRVLTSVSYTLALNQQIEQFSTTNSAGLGAINLTGNNLANIILGNNAINAINGGGGIDRMTGLGGSDNYYVDNALDVVIEGANGGTADRVLTSVNYTLAVDQQVELFTTTNSAALGSINLFGNNLANDIVGNNGSNVLDGGGGADRLRGLGGDDQYLVDNALDVVIEAAGGGTADQVFASVTHTLGVDQQIEILTTTNSAGFDAINLTGNNVANIIVGNDAANVITGGAGIDQMTGRKGNDFYYVDNALDTVTEGANGGTGDRVLTTVDYTLAVNQQIELFSTTNTAGLGAISLTGNNLANTILGNNGINSINGGLANDILTGGLGADRFLFNTVIAGGGNVDTIADFVHGTDDFQLSQAIFANIGASLDATELRLGATATTTTQRIVYDSVTGNLFFDADGSAVTAQVQFAKVTAGTLLDVSDFLML